MLATRCPECGATNPACLVDPDDYRCDSCGYRGLPSASDRAQIVAAADTVRALDEKRLQMNHFQGGTLASAKGLRAGYLFLFAALLLPAIFATAMVDYVHSTWGVDVLWLLLAPSLVMLVTFVTGAVVMARAHRRLLEGCAADPPRSEGESGRCHVCGGPLAAPPGILVARCGFCAADNIVGETAMRRVQRRLDHAVEGFMAALERRQARVSNTSVRVAAIALVAGLFGCGLVLFRAWEIDEHASAVSRAAHGYSLVQTQAGECVARRRGELLSFGVDRSPGLTAAAIERKGARTRALRPMLLRDRWVVLPGGDQARVADAVPKGGAPWLRLESGRGRIERPALGLCLPRGSTVAAR